MMKLEINITNKPSYLMGWGRYLLIQVVVLFCLAGGKVNAQDRKDSTTYTAMLDSCVAYLEQDSFSKAGALQEKCLDYYFMTVNNAVNTLDTLNYIRVLYRLSHIYYEKSKFEDAYPLLEEALIFKRCSCFDDDFLADIIHLQGLIKRMDRSVGAEKDSCLSLFKEALEIRLTLKPAQPIKVAASYIQLGNVFRIEKSYSHAIHCFNLADSILSFHNDDGDEPSWATLRHFQGNLYNQLGKKDSACIFYEKVILEYAPAIIKAHNRDSTATPLKTLPEVGMAYANMGDIRAQQGKYMEAEKHLDAALKEKRLLYPFYHPSIADSYNKLSVLFRKMGDYEKALSRQDTALMIRKEITGAYSLQVAQSYYNRANILIYMNRYDQAEKTFRTSLSLRERNEAASYLIADTYNSIGFLFFEKRQYEKALENYFIAIEIIKKDTYEEAIDSRALCYINISLVYLAQSKYELTASYARQAQEEVKKLKQMDIVKMVKALDLLAKSQLYQSEGQLALHSNHEAIKFLYDIGPDNPKHIPPIFESNDPKLLLELLLTKAAIIKQMAMHKFGKTHLPLPERLKDLLKSKDICSAIFILDEEIRAGEAASDNRTFVRENVAPAYALAMEICRLLYAGSADVAYLKEAFQLAERSKSILLLESIRNARAMKFTDVPDSLVELEKEILKEIHEKKRDRHQEEGKGVGANSRKLANLGGELEIKKAEYEALLKLFKDEYPDYYNLRINRAVADMDSVQEKLLDDKTALLEYAIGPEYCYLIALKRDAMQLYRLTKTDSIQQLITQFRDAFKSWEEIDAGFNKSKAFYMNTAYALYRELLAPADDFLGDSIDRLVIVPDGAIGLVNFDILLMEPDQDPANARYMKLPYVIKQYANSYAYSATVLMLNYNVPLNAKPASWVAFAPFYREGFLDSIQAGQKRQAFPQDRYLLGAHHEVTTLNNIYEVEMYEGAFATKDVFLQSIGNYNIVHVATHSALDWNNPMWSKIMFSSNDTVAKYDSVYAYEIYSSNLDSVKMVVLSSCETGVGLVHKGEGVLSLSRAFSYAGCQSIIMSLWKVPDYQTPEIMTYFYEQLDKGYPKDVALRLAKLQYLESTDNHQVLAHPMLWAPMVPVGDMRPIKLKTKSSYGYWFILLPVLGIIVAWSMFYRRKILKPAA